MALFHSPFLHRSNPDRYTPWRASDRANGLREVGGGLVPIVLSEVYAAPPAKGVRKRLFQFRVEALRNVGLKSTNPDSIRVIGDGFVEIACLPKATPRQ